MGTGAPDYGTRTKTANRFGETTSWCRLRSAERSWSRYETLQTQRSEGQDLHFDFPVRAKHTGKNAPPNFLGPFVQGPSSERFVYIDIGTYAGQSGTCWSRRLKIPLRGITWEMVEEVTGGESVLEAHVAGTGKDGSPSCATPKPFAGWKLSAPAKRR